ncbi:Uncharacterized protein F36G3.2 [Exaiptasia diaphana]|nr:Uncharacterized protein F36G3.2 [Exaiptasia diaphana]
MSLLICKLAKTDTSSIKFINEEMAALKWKPGLEDLECYLSLDDPGVYVAKLDGVPIGSVCFYKYSSTYYSFGIFIVKKEYQGKGYGMKLFNTAMSEVDWSQIVSAYSVPEMVNKYARYGFEFRWMCKGYDVNISKALEILTAMTFNPDLSVKNINEVDQEVLLRYDTAVFGYQRNNFILKWLHAKGRHAKVVVTDEGAIVGYVAARVLYVNEEGYRVGPLFADSTEVAQVLLKALFEDIIKLT